MTHADAVFLEVLPRIDRHAVIQSRDIRDLHRREDFLAEVRAYCLKWTRLLTARGKDVRKFPITLAQYAVLSIRSGRSLCKIRLKSDVLSPQAQARFGLRRRSLADVATLGWKPLQGALIDNTRSPVDEQVAFRLDFPAWVLTLPERHRRIVEQMIQGEATQHLATRFGLTPGRVSQLRREFLDGWRRFCGEAC